MFFLIVHTKDVSQSQIDKDSWVNVVFCRDFIIRWNNSTHTPKGRDRGSRPMSLEDAHASSLLLLSLRSDLWFNIFWFASALRSYQTFRRTWLRYSFGSQLTFFFSISRSCSFLSCLLPCAHMHARHAHTHIQRHALPVFIHRISVFSRSEKTLIRCIE